MPFCIGNGISYNGSIINGNEFQIYSDVFMAAIDWNLKIDYIYPRTSKEIENS